MIAKVIFAVFCVFVTYESVAEGRSLVPYCDIDLCESACSQIQQECDHDACSCTDGKLIV